MRLIAALVAAALAFAGAHRVDAHATLLGSVPEARARLEAAPSELTLRFNENVGPVFFKVLDRTGAEVGRPGALRLDGNDVHLPLAEALPNGSYVVTYRVVSADTHPLGGSFVFAIGEPLADVGAASAVKSTSRWLPAVAVTRAILYAGVLLAVGSALLLLLLRWPGESAAAVRGQGRAAAIVAALAYVAAVGVGGADIMAGGAAALFSSDAWMAGVKSTLGMSALLGLPGALLALRAFASRSGGALWTSAALLVASFLVTGHAATAAPVWLMATNVAAHVVGAGFWCAALWPLVQATRKLPVESAGALMHGFSTRALWLVTLLVASGVVLSVVQVSAFDRLATTVYGQRLSIKVLAVVLLLGLATVNKLRLTPAMRRAAGGSPERMRRSIRTEMAVMAVVVIAAASLTIATPPRALSASARAAGARGSGAEGYKATWPSGEYLVDVDVSPSRPGENTIMLQFRDKSGQPFAMQQASIDVSLPEASIESIGRDGEAMSPGMYHFKFSEMIVAGDWQIRVSAFVDDFDKVTFTGTVPIR